MESKSRVKSVPLTVEPNNNFHKKLLVTSKPAIQTNSTKQSTYRLQQSNLLDRVKNFLPKLKSSNEELSAMNNSEKEQYDIENIDDCEKVIEMDISVVDNDVLLSDDDSDSDSISSEDESKNDEKTLNSFSTSGAKENKRKALLVEEMK